MADNDVNNNSITEQVCIHKKKDEGINPMTIEDDVKENMLDEVIMSQKDKDIDNEIKPIVSQSPEVSNNEIITSNIQHDNNSNTQLKRVATNESKVNHPDEINSQNETDQHLPNNQTHINQDNDAHNNNISSNCNSNNNINLDNNTNNKTNNPKIVSRNDSNDCTFTNNNNNNYNETIECNTSTTAYLKMLTDDIHKKEQIIKSLSSTNSLLRKNLLKLSDSVSELCQKKVIKPNVFNKEKTKEPTPLEIEIQKKDKELRKCIIQLDTYSKENKILKKKLEAYGEFDMKTDLDNIIKAKTNENEQLIKDNKMLKKLLLNHNNCNKEKEELESMINSLRKDVNKEKQKANEYSANYKLLESKYNTLIQGSTKTKTDSEVKPNTQAKKPINQHLNSFKTQPIQRNKGELNNSVNVNINSKTSLNPQTNISVGSSKENLLKKTFNSCKLLEVFNEEEIGIIKQLFKGDIEKHKMFIKKINIIEKYRTSNEILQKNQLKNMQDEIIEQREQERYINERLRDSEGKVKLMTFQRNDLKQSNIAYQKKIVDLQNTIEGLNEKIKEKEKERAYAKKELELLQKLFQDSQPVELNDGINEELLKIKKGKNIVIP